MTTLTRATNRRTFLKGSAGVAGAAMLSRAGGRSARAQSSNVEIDFMHIWGTPPGAEASATKHPAEQLVEAFNAKGLGVTVNSRVESTDYFETMQKAQAEMAAGKSPALMATPWSQIYYATEGLNITRLEDIAAATGVDIAEVLGNLKPEVIGLVTLDGTTIGVPFAFSNPVIYYNIALLQAAEVDPAAMFADWAGFATGGKALTAASGNPTFGFGTNNDWPAQSIVQSNGGRILDDNQQPAMDSPEAIEAMQTIADLHKDGLLLSAKPADVRAAFAAGTIPVFVTSIAGLGGLRNDAAFEFNTSPFPVFTGKPRMMSSGGSFIGCYAREEEQQRAAWEFLKFAVSQEGTEIWMRTGYLNATTFEVEHLPGQEAAYTHLAEGLTRETAWPGARGGEIQKLWGTYVERIWANDIGAEEGAKEAKAEIEALLG